MKIVDSQCRAAWGQRSGAPVEIGLVVSSICSARQLSRIQTKSVGVCPASAVQKADKKQGGNPVVFARYEHAFLENGVSGPQQWLFRSVAY